ncbi:MAG: hypothetical protein ACRYF3_16770 [Janthinobacterium lividum]
MAQPCLGCPLPAPDDEGAQPADDDQAQAALPAALLRQLHALVTTGRAWDPVIATHGTRRRELRTAA